MADWATVGIALVSAGAALGGVHLKSIHDKKARNESATREDAAILRERMQELLLEIDAMHVHSNANFIDYIKSVNYKQPLENSPLPVSAARMRALILLHFPECREALDAFEAREKHMLEVMIEQIEKDPGSIQMAGVLTQKSRLESLATFHNVVREALQETALSIGVSRDDLNVR